SERDRGAHDRRLPFERHGEIARPGQPMIAGPVEKLPAGGVDRAQEGFVLTEDQVHRTREWEGDLVDDVGERRVRGQPQDLSAADVANMIGADDHIGRRTSVIVRRPDANSDARQAGERFDPPDDLRRPILAFKSLEPRPEIGNAHFGAMRVGQNGLDDGRIALVARTGLHDIRERDLAEPNLLVVGQQPRKNRIGIEIRETPPHDARIAVDEGGGAGVADQRQIEILAFRMTAPRHAPSSRPAYSASQSRTALGCVNVPMAPGRLLPTEKSYLPRAATTAKPLSSVVSSPTKTGVRPRNGGLERNAA